MQKEKELEKTQAKPAASSIKKATTPWWVWLLVVILGLALVGGVQYWRFTRSMAARREAMQAQRAKMVDFWKSQGLSEAEIQQKMKEERPQNFQRNGQPGIAGMMFRMMGGGFRGRQGQFSRP